MFLVSSRAKADLLAVGRERGPRRSPVQLGRNQVHVRDGDESGLPDRDRARQSVQRLRGQPGGERELPAYQLGGRVLPDRNPDGDRGFFITPSTPPGGTLNAPWQIAFDSNNNAYVTNETTPNPPFGYIAQFTGAGGAATFTQSFGGLNTNVPTGIGFNPFNHLLYVVNSATTGGPGPNLNSILIYNPANIAGQPTIVTPTGAGALDGAQQIAFVGAGNVYIASVGATTGVAKILEYNQNGVFIGAGKFLTPAGDTNAVGVAIDPFNNVLYASFLNGGTNGVIEKYNLTTGADLGVFASGLSNVAYLAFTPVPEPGSIVLTGMGLIGLAGFNVYRRKRVA